MELLAVIAVAFVLIAPIFGMIAFLKTQKLTRDLEALQARLIRLAEPAEKPPAQQPLETPVSPSPFYSAPEPQPALGREPFSKRADVPFATGAHSDVAHPSTDIEAVIGGRWLNVIGLAAVLLASAFFLKYAFDNNWIGPIGRVVIGLLGGSALILASQSILRRGWTYFSEGFTGLGAGILYLSIYAAWSYYHLIPPEAAFVGMAAVTASLVLLALGRDSQRLGVLALLGGYLTPLLVSTGHDAQIQLFAYLAVLNAGLLWMALARDWRSLPASFVFTLIYGWLWYSQFYDPSKLITSLAFATIFFLEFAAVPAIQAVRSGQLRSDAIARTLLNAFWYLSALDSLLYDSHRWLLTAAVLGVAAFFLVLANLTTPRANTGQPAARPIFGSLALTCVTVAIPIRLEGQWIAMMWAIEGAILIWNGLRSEVAWLRTAGFIALTLVAVYLVDVPIPAAHAFLNGRFATLAVMVCALAAVCASARIYAARVTNSERPLFKVAEVAANIYAVWAISAETWLALSPKSLTRFGEWAPEQQYGLTVVWASYAVGLAIFGFWRDSSRTRWQALVLFALVMVTAPFFDGPTEQAAGNAFINLRFLTCVVVFAALATSLWLSGRPGAQLSGAERSAYRIFGVTLNAFAVWALSTEVWLALSANAVSSTAAQQLALSLVWTLYAATLIVIGMRHESKIVRWQALSLFALVIFKAAFFDLSQLALGYRIASLMALGVMLLGASFLYQRRLFGQRSVKP